MIAFSDPQAKVDQYSGDVNQSLYNLIETPDCDRVKYFVYLALKNSHPEFRVFSRERQANILDNILNQFRQATGLTDEQAFIDKCDYFDQAEDIRLKSLITD